MLGKPITTILGAISAAFTFLVADGVAQQVLPQVAILAVATVNAGLIFYLGATNATK